MSTRAKTLIGILGAAVVALAIGLGVAVATDGDGNDNDRYWASGDTPYYGIMHAAGEGDWQAMSEYMLEVLGEDGFREMQEHMTRDGCQWSTDDKDLDAFMHDMSYGMMYRAFNNGANPPTGSACW